MQGKLETEAYLKKTMPMWTSIRPVYIYGPLNYNPVEEWFFHRIKEGRPIPVPGSGMQVRHKAKQLRSTVADVAFSFAQCTAEV